MSTQAEASWTRALPWLAAGVAAALYLISMGYGFTFDDPHIIVENPMVTGGGGLWPIFTSHYWAAEEARGALYRPLTVATYWMNYRLAGAAPWSYHLVNVLLHAGVTALLFFVCLRLGSAPGAAGAAAILFAVHPVHVEAVANVVGRAELLAALFTLAAWCWRSKTWPAAGLFLCGLLSKENAVVLPGLLLVEDLLLRRRWVGRDGLIRRYLPFAAVLALFLAARAFVVGAGPGIQQGPFAGQPVLHRMLTAVEVLGRYTWLVIYPARLSADYSYNQIPLVTSALDPGFLAGAAATGALLAAAWLLRQRSPRAAAGIAIFLVALLPVSNLFFGIGVIMGERLLYLPSIGLCLAAGEALALLASWRLPARTSRAAAAACLAAALPAAPLAARAWTRERVWSDQRALFEQTVRDSPRSALARVNLGILCQSLGRSDEAEEAYRAAIEIAPDRPGPHFNLGTLLESTERMDEAIAAYRRAVEIDPADPRASNNLGRALLARGRSREAIEILTVALQLNPGAPTLAVNLAAAWLHAGDPERAERILREVLAAHPRDEAALRLLEAVRQRADRVRAAPDGVAP